ncbi:MAG: TIGR01777 family protein, partial [Nitrospiraceae bacterium]
MNIIIAGGSGFIGRPLCRALAENGHQVTVLSRREGEASGPLDQSIRVVGWNGRIGGDWERSLEGTEAVINLAGESVADKRWTPDRKQALRDSRIGTTRLLVQALSRLSRRPTTLIVASGVGYYGPRDATPVTEQAPPGSDFLATLSRDCEHEAMQAERYGLRVVRLRIGIVLGKEGGALPRMALPFRFFLGGPLSPGDQWVSWIHRRDFIGLMR